MAKELNEDTSFKISLKTLGGIAVLIFTLVGMWFTLQAEISLAKELTKKYEQNIFTTIDDTLKSFKNLQIKGEFTIVIRGINKKEEVNNLEIKKDLINLIKAGLSHAAASNYLSKKTGKSKKYIYQLILNNEGKFIGD